MTHLVKRLLLFAKRPLPGRVKRRLVPPLSPIEALGIYRAFLEDQIRFVDSLRSPSLEVEVCADGPWSAWPVPDGIRIRLAWTEQGRGDLGRRMLVALRRCQAAGAAASVILAVDAPTVPKSYIDDAFSALDGGCDAVLAPARDGGYVLLGMAEPRPELFREVPWGSAAVLDVTRRRAAQAGIRLAELDPWYDVDDAAAMARLWDELGRRGRAAARRAPATARWLAGGGARLLGLGCGRVSASNRPDHPPAGTQPDHAPVGTRDGSRVR
jgi:hypothetical protein